MIDFVDGLHGYQAAPTYRGFGKGGGGGGHGGGHGGGFRPGVYTRGGGGGYPDYPYPYPETDPSGEFVRSVVQAYKTGGLSAGIAQAGPSTRMAYRALGQAIVVWSNGACGPVARCAQPETGTPAWWARGYALAEQIRAMTGISAAFSGLEPTEEEIAASGQLAGYGQLSVWDAFLATIGITGPLASDLSTGASSAPDPNTAVANTQQTLNAALSAGTITGDQYNQAMAQITAQAQAGTIGGSILNAGQGILSSGEGIAIVAGIAVLALWFGPDLIGHTVRSSASNVRRGTK
jgi:hypothetical protein